MCTRSIYFCEETSVSQQRLQLVDVYPQYERKEPVRHIRSPYDMIITIVT
jgi:hypothetical protein